MINHAEYLKTIDEVIARGPFHADWNSLGNYQVPEWYRKANFHGIIRTVAQLGSDIPVEWTRTEDALCVKAAVLGKNQPVAFRITLA